MTQRARVIAPRCLAATLAVPILLGAAPGPAQHATPTIVIDKMKFGAAPVGLHVGDKITWINRDLFRHTATARDGSFNLDLMPGKSATLTLRKAGTVTFYCTFHPGMRGQLIVAGDPRADRRPRT